MMVGARVVNGIKMGVRRNQNEKRGIEESRSAGTRDKSDEAARADAVGMRMERKCAGGEMQSSSLASLPVQPGEGKGG